MIHDFDPGFFALQIRHVPVLPHQLFGRSTRGGRTDLTVNQQVHASRFGIVAAADQKANVAAVDREKWRRQSALWTIATEKRIDQSLPLKAVHLLLAIQSTAGGMGAKRLTVDRPIGRSCPLRNQRV